MHLLYPTEAVRVTVVVEVAYSAHPGVPLGSMSSMGSLNPAQVRPHVLWYPIALAPALHDITPYQVNRFVWKK